MQESVATGRKIGYGELIVSCQASEEEPLRDTHVQSMLAYAVVTAGVRFIRAGAEDVAEIRRRTGAVVIGLRKDQKLQNSGQAFITVRKTDVREVVESGAEIVAIDCTRRERPEPLDELFHYVRSNFPHVEIIADVADVEDARRVLPLAPDYIATTLSGYTDYTAERKLPDIELISELVKITDVPIIAEGGYTHPSEVRLALLKGAHAVVVGSALTRPHTMARRYLEAVSDLKLSRAIFGVDIGGTYVRTIVADRFGRVLEKRKFGNPKEPALLLDRIVDEVKRVEDAFGIRHVGVATAGRVDPVKGVLSFASGNIPGWSGVKLKDFVESRTGREVFVDNDANAATFAQWWLRPVDNMMLVTFGTGVGAGAIVNGHLLRGKLGGALEVGHVVLPGNERLCTCGKRGCVETVLKADELGKLVSDGERGLEEASERLAWLLDTLKSVLDFEVVYLHGVIKEFGTNLLERTEMKFKEMFAMNSEKIAYSELDEFGGALGAALMSVYYGGAGHAKCAGKD